MLTHSLLDYGFFDFMIQFSPKLVCCAWQYIASPRYSWSIRKSVLSRTLASLFKRNHIQLNSFSPHLDKWKVHFRIYKYYTFVFVDERNEEDQDHPSRPNPTYFLPIPSSPLPFFQQRAVTIVGLFSLPLSQMPSSAVRDEMSERRLHNPVRVLDSPLSSVDKSPRALPIPWPPALALPLASTTTESAAAASAARGAALAAEIAAARSSCLELMSSMAALA